MPTDATAVTSPPSSASRPPRRATLEEWAAMPDKAGAELLNGCLVYKATPSPEHGRSQLSLGGLLSQNYDLPPGGPADSPGGWWISCEVDLQLGSDGVRPDLVGWRRDRVPLLPKPQPPIGRATERPDWICEVVSHSNAGNDTVDKIGIYHRAQVGHYWLLDPERQTLTVLRWTKEGYLVVLVADHRQTVRAEPFEAAEIKVGSVLGL